MQLSGFPSITYGRDCLFSIVQYCLFCHRLIDHRCVSLFLGYLVLLIYIPIFVLVPYCFDYCSSVIQPEVRELDCTSCFSFLRLLWLSVLHTVVYICLQFIPPFPYPHHHLSTCPFSTSASLLLPCKQYCPAPFFYIPYISLIYDICFSDLLHSV